MVQGGKPPGVPAGSDREVLEKLMADKGLKEELGDKYEELDDMVK